MHITSGPTPFPSTHLNLPISVLSAMRLLFSIPAASSTSFIKYPFHSPPVCPGQVLTLSLLLLWASGLEGKATPFLKTQHPHLQCGETGPCFWTVRMTGLETEAKEFLMKTLSSWAKKPGITVGRESQKYEVALRFGFHFLVWCENSAAGPVSWQ